MTCAGELDIGSLIHQIALQSETETKQGNGEVTLVYATYDTVWASVRPMQGKELESAQQISAVATHKIRIYYNSALEPIHRIVFETRTFEIEGILDFQERHIYQDILCKEIV